MLFDLSLTLAATLLLSSAVVWGFDLRDTKAGRLLERLAFVSFDHDFKLPFVPVQRCERHNLASCVECFGRKRGG